ncbi:MAG: hypothetical protein ACE14L_02020 [Terriglobales bacterium]
MSDCLSKTDAEKKPRLCLEQGTVEQYLHFTRALKDGGLDFAAILPVLRRGPVYAAPEFDLKFQEWRYKVEGREADGRRVAIVFCFPAEESTLLITAYIVANK